MDDSPRAARPASAATPHDDRPELHRAHRPSPLVVGLLFGCAGVALAFQPLAAVTYRMLVAPDAPLSVERAIGRGLPVPRSLQWSPAGQDIILSFGAFSPAGSLWYALLFWGILAYALLQTLNPTFRLTTGVDWRGDILTRTYMHTPPLIKAFLILVAAALPVFAAWEGIRVLLGENLGSLWIRLSLVGAAAWLLLSREGVAGDYESGSYLLPRDPAVLRSLLVRGALAGTAATLCTLAPPLAPAEDLIHFYALLGGIGEVQWKATVLVVCGTAFALGVAGGALAAVLAGDRDWFTRARLAIPPLLSLLVAVWLVVVWMPALLAGRFDFRPDLNAEARPGITRGALALARAAGVPLGAGGMQTAIIAGPLRRAIVVQAHAQSVTGLAATPRASERIEAFLKRRGYVTALADPAFKTMHDAASLEWNSEESLRVDFLNLSRCPNPEYVQLFVDKLQMAASSRAARQWVDRLADERVFSFEERNARRLVADVYARLGLRDRAREWYRRAEVPESRIEGILNERTMFVDGRLTGRLLVDGRPASGARVGLIPLRTIPREYLEAAGPVTIQPFWLRWIDAATLTDAAGRFEMRGLIAGRYRLVFGSPEVRADDGPVRLLNAPETVFVGYASKHVRLGDVEVRTGGQER